MHLVNTYLTPMWVIWSLLNETNLNVECWIMIFSDKPWLVNKGDLKKYNFVVSGGIYAEMMNKVTKRHWNETS